MQIGPEAKYFISVTWELTPPHRGGFCNYILSCQTLLLVVYHAPYVSHRDNNSGVNFWSNTVWSWTNGNMGKSDSSTMPQQYVTGQQWENTCSSTVRFIRGRRVGHWPLTLNSCNELCPWFFAFGTHKLCPLVTRFLERHGKVTRGSSSSPWCFRGGNVCCTTGW